MRHLLLLTRFLPPMFAHGQEEGRQLTLKGCYELARQRNALVKQAERSLQAGGVFLTGREPCLFQASG